MSDIPGLIDLAAKVSVTFTPVVIVAAAWWVERTVRDLVYEWKKCRLTCAVTAQLPKKTKEILEDL